MHLLLKHHPVPVLPGWSKDHITGDTLPKKFPRCEMHLPHYSVLYEKNPKERGTSDHSPAGGTPD